ncbi:hypothetical protein KC717_02880, partial [Candidatus Dojkabacteria bacterium]|nr:hypothetical protein [Candidatus Dojkabacteria bacterium]
MKSNVSLCTELELDGFFSVFEKSIYQDYPEYSTDLQRYYLQKEYTINHFAHWMSTGFRVVYVV